MHRHPLGTSSESPGTFFGADPAKMSFQATGQSSESTKKVGDGDFDSRGEVRLAEARPMFDLDRWSGGFAVKGSSDVRRLALILPLVLGSFGPAAAQEPLPPALTPARR